MKALAPQHPEWKTKQPFGAVLEGDMRRRRCDRREEGLIADHRRHPRRHDDRRVRRTTVKDWIATAQASEVQAGPTPSWSTSRCSSCCAYLRANGFKTFIVSGGGVEFMRPWTEEVYGIPPEQVVGSSGKMKFELRDGKPVLMKLPEIELHRRQGGQARRHPALIGRRPIVAFGNSDGDLQMLQWTTAGTAPRFGLIVHHTDAEREYAYDRASHIGKLDKALDEAHAARLDGRDMKGDWKTVFPFDKK